MTTAAAPAPRVIICGGGIVGVSTAYYLVKLGCKATILERHSVAACASGKAGGFLAKDWNDRSPVGALSRVSFDLHDKLAWELGAETIDYRRLSCIGVSVSERPSDAPPQRKLEQSSVQWDRVDSAATPQQMGDAKTIAQVHPAKLTRAMADAAVAAGASVRIATVTGVRAGAPAFVTLADGETLEADAVLIAMGPWSDQLEGGLQLPEMLGQKYHSLCLQIERTLDQAVFFHGRGDIEIYPRPRGEVYVTGYTGDPPQRVTELPGAVEVRESKLEPQEQLARTLCADLKDAKRIGEQSCYLPITLNGVPAIGRVPGAPGVFVGAGHGCWGILNGPATGLALTELIMHGKARCVSLDAFEPRGRTRRA
ncbi:FAD dependent oxidoreductase [Pavlovales sp. CCMP2436]|nr:FAD dependent oxidoreductase [Pavlovales sp. CCMP2436]|mmetsp:Transcript_3523/g.8831  ORF Transcript_3523/g.8831 Transcript_3523/m.8831 type:complete len:368 (+) Transcript_3523:60-1163(+)|eukprot:CAMPEP_0179980852 /NCGR_PEP_ID=MMETSP0983-20121128/42181_1 /TAXON_ID=483367 /ORGANISM="non described non described, Strain CCMP 2436" /LENGTH=367 /DNA_ID=CAMNT_0021898869 /DNA_START=22 /DNA_END=1125 /DNA_ORIENTATION=+